LAAARLRVHLIAVFGYSERRTKALHALCAERLRQAEDIAIGNDVVLLSGRGRWRDGADEAELMRAAWNGKNVQLIKDGSARNTRGNAASVAAAARSLGATEVTVVTSRWHAFRAGALVRAALPDVAVRTSSPAGRPPVRLLLRELLCLVALPYHLLRLRARRRRLRDIGVTS